MKCCLIVLILWINALLSLCEKIIKNLENDVKFAIVEKHNELRRELGEKDSRGRKRRDVDAGSNMRLLEWDSKLERIAKDWSNKCTKDYGFIYNNHYRNLVFNEYREFLTSIIDKEPSFAQNIASAGKGAVSKKDAKNIIQSWYDEVKHFNWRSGACKTDCSRFRTLVDSRISRIGCGLGNCNKNFIVCVYDASILPKETFPYAKGPACENCAKSEICEDKLCRVTKRVPLPCVDKPNDDAVCTQLLKKINFQCFPNNIDEGDKRKYVSAIKKCPKRCGACENIVGCADVDQCLGIDEKACVTPKLGKYKTCKKSCGFCMCEDKRPTEFCKALMEKSKHRDECEVGENRYLCRKTCGLCDIKSSPLCADKELDGYCWTISVRNKCKDNRNNCRATCGECGLFEY